MGVTSPNFLGLSVPNREAFGGWMEFSPKASLSGFLHRHLQSVFYLWCMDWSDQQLLSYH